MERERERERERGRERLSHLTRTCRGYQRAATALKVQHAEKTIEQVMARGSSDLLRFLPQSYFLQRLRVGEMMKTMSS